jgi:hypothetical protein
VLANSKPVVIAEIQERRQRSKILMSRVKKKKRIFWHLLLPESLHFLPRNR